MFKRLRILALALLSAAVPAFAQIHVNSPMSGDTVTSVLSISASAQTCKGQPVSAMGISFDYGTTTIESNPFTTTVIAPTGAHTLHVKCWGSNGAADMVDVQLNVVAATNTITSIQNLTNWVGNHDSATGATSTGSTALTSSPSLSGSARQFKMSFTNNGGEIFYASFPDILTAHNFVYDSQVFVLDPSSIGNIEMDLNQVTANGQTIIFGFQCDGWTGTWDYTTNSGTPTAPIDKWIHSTATCPAPQTWKAGVYHHVQIAYSRDDYGNVTYKSVTFDGVEQQINATVPSAFALGWGPVLLTNFQIDGKGTSGSSTSYIDNLTLYVW